MIIFNQISDSLSSNRMPPSIPRITGRLLPARVKGLQCTSFPVQSHTVAFKVLSCSRPWLSPTLRTTVYSPMARSVAKFRMMPVSATKTEIYFTNSTLISLSFCLNPVIFPKNPHILSLPCPTNNLKNTLAYMK